MFFHDDLPHIWSRSHGVELYRAPAVDKPFERVAIKCPDQGFFIQIPKLVASQHHGIVVYDSVYSGEIRFTRE